MREDINQEIRDKAVECWVAWVTQPYGSPILKALQEELMVLVEERERTGT